MVAPTPPRYAQQTFLDRGLSFRSFQLRHDHGRWSDSRLSVRSPGLRKGESGHTQAASKCSANHHLTRVFSSPQGQTGTIVKVHPNWTCDVMWQATKRVRSGYACGTAAGKVRAFHLALVTDEFGDKPNTEWNRCKTGIIPSRAPYV